MAGLQYIPLNTTENECYSKLWNIANPNGADTIGGSQAVTFFKKSNLNIAILRKVWELSTSSAHMTKSQFDNALRFITLLQRGEALSIGTAVPVHWNSTEE